MGRMCMAMGVAAFTLSANRALLKQVRTWYLIQPTTPPHPHTFVCLCSRAHTSPASCSPPVTSHPPCLPPQVVPSLAPSARSIDHIIRQASGIEHKVISVLASIAGPHHPPAPPATTTTISGGTASAPTITAAVTPGGQAYVPEAVEVLDGTALPADGLRRRRVN